MRNIGVDVKPPSKTCSDSLCPFHGNLPIRGRLFRGRVVSLKSGHMAVVEGNYLQYIRKYMRYEKRKSNIHAHLPTCLEISEGDTVAIAECRSLAKTVSFVVIEKVVG